MHPFGLLPDYPQWERQILEEEPALANMGVKVHGSTVVQRIGTDLVSTGIAAAPRDSELALRMQFEDPKLSSSSGGEFDLNALWTPHNRNIVLDLDPSIDPELLANKYEETLVNQSPLSLFPKQVLYKAQRGVNLATYISHLEQLLLSPNDLDIKYAYDGKSEVGPFVARIRSLDNDMRPLTTVLRELKVRETQLQVILGLEVVSHKPEHEFGLDRHFDRLCIWQAVHASGDMVGDFCATVLVPYFKAKAPRKVKQLIKINRGTLKSRSRSLKQSRRPSQGSSQEPSTRSTSIEPKESSSAVPLSGLAKALHMQKLATHTDKPDQNAIPQPDADPKRRLRLELASRSASHPMYKQQSFVNQLEVKFSSRKSRRRPAPSRSSASPSCASPLSASPSCASPSSASPSSAYPRSASPPNASAPGEGIPLPDDRLGRRNESPISLASEEPQLPADDIISSTDSD